ncbi:hypothetical protein LOK49_LG01G03938 [Camellia lanceoleosa]|uniref:Uncharacterized protein n=1 Tax=Camellia lanceoleosa TaxID=1840588 RepID=A0ACC0IVD6_9ERIC|nr:hypothetical protein LOK49_LG01G03938 [Camellia lanceoleosa]
MRVYSVMVEFAGYGGFVEVKIMSVGSSEDLISLIQLVLDFCTSSRAIELSLLVLQIPSQNTVYTTTFKPLAMKPTTPPPSASHLGQKSPSPPPTLPSPTASPPKTFISTPSPLSPSESSFPRPA